MESIGILSQGGEKYYLDLSDVRDYYLNGGEPPGVWRGSGCESLGLTGTVERDPLRRLFNGFHPDGSRPLVQQQKWTDGRKRQPGLDLCFSAPKTVSVLWSVSDDDTRKEIENAHFKAVCTAVAYLEETAGITRRGKNGLTPESAKLIVALFEHGTSRSQDAQLHTHALFLNVCERLDKTHGTIRTHDLFLHKMAGGAVYRAALANNLTNDLGLQLERGEGKTWGFAVKHVPKKLCDEHSKRRREIEHALDKGEIRNAREAAWACKTTRSRKEHVARALLFPKWCELGEKFGLTTEKARSLFGRVEHVQIVDAVKLAEKAVADITKHKSYFAERDIVRAVCEGMEHSGHGSPQDAIGAAKEVLGRRDKIHRFKDHEGRDLFTTQSLRNLEETILTRCEHRKNETRHVLSRVTVEKVLSHKDFATIRPDQRAAVEHVLLGKGGVSCVNGYAGTGKTYMINVLRRAYEMEGYTVTGCALAATAAKQLENGSGVKSRSITKTLMMLRPSVKATLIHEAKQLKWAARGAKRRYDMDTIKLTKKSVLIVDEAGMVGTKHIAELLGEACKKGVKIIFSGDDRQVTSIEAGAPFSALMRAVGSATLTEITRQHEKWMADAVMQFAHGDALGALRQYQLAGRLHIEEDIDAVQRRLVDAWNEGRTKSLKDTLILAGTNKEMGELNRLAQEKRKNAGELGRVSVQHKGARVHTGDRIQFRENRTSLGLANGQYGTVKYLVPSLRKGKTTVVVSLDDTIRKGAFMRQRTVRFTLKEYDDFALGYASTTHRAQGSTVDKSYVLGGGWMTDRELAYVQMSRARERTEIFTTNARAGEDLAEVAKEMSRSRAKVMSVTKEDNERQYEQERKWVR